MKILNNMKLLLYLWGLGIQPINQQHLRHMLTKEIIRKCILKTSIIFTLIFWHKVDSRLLRGWLLNHWATVKTGVKSDGNFPHWSARGVDGQEMGEGSAFARSKGSTLDPQSSCPDLIYTLICCSWYQKDLWGPWPQQPPDSPPCQPYCNQPHFTRHKLPFQTKYSKSNLWQIRQTLLPNSPASSPLPPCSPPLIWTLSTQNVVCNDITTM